MKHLKLFESHSKNEKIREVLEDHFIYLLDDGYRSSFSHNNDYSITVFNLYKSKIDFNNDFSKSSNWMKNLQSDTMKVASIQKRLSSLEVENVISKVQFHVYTYYNYPENKSTLDPGLIEYSSILNGEIVYRDMSAKIIELEMDIKDLEENGMIQKPVSYYYDIQIQSEIDYGNEDAYSVFFK